MIIVSSNGVDNILFGDSNYGESVDISGPSGVFAASCVQNEFTSTYYKIEDNNKAWYGYSFVTVDYSTAEDITIIPDVLSNFQKSCALKGYATGNSTSQPIVAGSAALLFSNDYNLEPHEVKSYLVSTSGLNEVTKRHTKKPKVGKKGKVTNVVLNNICPDIPETGVCDYTIPILNIEASMKQYEADHPAEVVFKEDFIGIKNDIINSTSPINYLDYSFAINDGNVFTLFILNDFEYYGINALNNTPLSSESVGFDVVPNKHLFYFHARTQNLSECATDIFAINLTCIKTLSFKYYTDENISLEINGEIFNLTRGVISYFSANFIIDASEEFYVNINFSLEGKLFIDNLAFSDAVENFFIFSTQSIASYTNENITYSALGDIGFLVLEPSIYYDFFSTEFMIFNLDADRGGFEINLPFELKYLNFSYTTEEYRTDVLNPYFNIYDENNNLLYSDINLAGFKTVNEVVIDIPNGTKKIIFRGDLSNLYIDYFEYTY